MSESEAIDVDLCAPGPRRGHAFSIQEFGDLVSSALDVQRVPDSTLAFSFSAKTPSPARRSPRLPGGNGARRYASGTFRKFKDAFMRKTEPQSASPCVPPRLPLVNDTRRLASLSVPTLSHPRSESAHASASSSNLYTYDLGLDSDASPTPTTPTTPSDSTFFRFASSIPSREHNEQHVNSNDRPLFENKQNRTNARSFLSLDSLAIPKLTKQSSKMFSGSPPSPLPDQPVSPHKDSFLTNIQLSRVESDGMRSFFDDSGYGEDALPSSKVVRKGSKPTLPSLFPSSSLAGSNSPTQTRYDVQVRKRSDKALPPTPPTGERPLHSRSPQSSMPAKDRNKTRQHLDDNSGSLFLARKTSRAPQPDLAAHIAAVREHHAHRLSNWIARSSNQTPRKARVRIRCSPPPYPSPTSPLPPTPELSNVGLPSVSPPNSDHYHPMDHGGLNRKSEDGSGKSVDSAEISSWRMPALEQRTSKTCTTSSADHAHVSGRPSHSSIRKRLGLGPRLHLHVPIPIQTRTQSFSRSKSRNASPASFNHSKTLPRLTVRPSSGIFSSPTKMPISKLASVSLVSLRSSIATITAAGSHDYDEDEGSDGKHALGVDRAFTPEDDPFAAAPPQTPLTPISAHMHNKDMKHRSFMPLGNDSTGSMVMETPTSAPATQLGRNSRLGSRSRLSSPDLTPASSVSVAVRYPKGSEAGVATLARVDSGLPSSLIEALGPRQRTPSSPSVPPSSCRRNMSHVFATAQKTQGMHKSSSLNKMSEASSASIVGHTTSRPNSPFPMLFLRSALAGAMHVKEERQSSLASSKTGVIEVREVAAKKVPKHVPRLFLARRIQAMVREPPPLSSREVDAFGDACEIVQANISEARHNIVSPTAWLLDSDDYDDNDTASMTEESADADKSSGLELDIKKCSYASKEKSYNRSKNSSHQSTALPPRSGSRSSQWGALSSSGELHMESEAETDTDTKHGLDVQGWPLPPYRTVVVDEENGECWHDVAPIVEYVQPDGVIPDTPRHSIRFPITFSGPASIRTRSSRSSNGESPTSQRLSSHQARLIAEKLGCVLDQFRSTDTNLTAPQQLPSRPLRQRASSTTSLASVGTSRTCKSAYYTVRSSASRGSDISTYSSTRSRQIVALSREGSLRSTASSRRPGSGHDSKHTLSTPHTGRKQLKEGRPGNCESYIPSEVPSSIQPARSFLFLGPYAMGTDVMPQQRVILRADAPDSTFIVVTSGWARLISACAQNAGVRVETEGEDADAVLCVSLEEVDGTKSDLALRQSRPGADGPSDANIFIKLTLSLQAGIDAEKQASDVAFFLPLPVTFGAIAEHIRRSSLRRRRSRN